MKDDQRVMLTKRLLREGLLQLLEEKELSAIRVTELCACSGINRATFYRHYQQPRDIIDELRHEMFQDVKALAQKEGRPRTSAKWVEEMCRYFHSRRALLKILFRCRSDEDFVPLINELHQEQVRAVRGAGYGAGLDDMELKLGAYWFAGGVYYLLRQWIMEPVDKSPQEVANVIYRLLGERTEGV